MLLLAGGRLTYAQKVLLLTTNIARAGADASNAIAQTTFTSTVVGRQAGINAPGITNTPNPCTDWSINAAQVVVRATAALTCRAAQLTVFTPANITPADLKGAGYPLSVVLSAINTSITPITPTSGSATLSPVILGSSFVATEKYRAAPPVNSIWVETPLPSAIVATAPPRAANAVQISNALVRATNALIQKTVSSGPPAGVSSVFCQHAPKQCITATASTTPRARAGPMKATVDSRVDLNRRGRDHFPALPGPLASEREGLISSTSELNSIHLLKS